MRYRSTHLDGHGSSFQSQTPWIIRILTPPVSFPSVLLETSFATPSSLRSNGYSTARCLLTLRRLGIARRLPTAVARTFIHGYPLDPEEGRVAFSQPTDSGQAVMDAWGREAFVSTT